MMYVSFVLGLSIGVLSRPRPSSHSTNVIDQLPANIWPVEDMLWNEPHGLRDAIPPEPTTATSNAHQFSGDTQPLNWPIDRCVNQFLLASQCAYLNATTAVHPRVLLEQWSAKLTNVDSHVVAV